MLYIELKKEKLPLEGESLKNRLKVIRLKIVRREGLERQVGWERQKKKIGWKERVEKYRLEVKN
jgi:hypothetical protein